MKNLSFDHVHYRSSNLEKSRHFYTHVMEGVELPPAELGGNLNLQCALGGVTLLFVLSTKDPIPEPVAASDRLGVYHIAFLVDNCDAATEYYVNRGAVVAIAPFNASPTIRASFLSAPDGMMVELKQIIHKPSDE